MINRMKRLAVLLFLISALCPAEIAYFVEPDVPARSFRIKVTVDDPGEAPRFCIPAWCPGWYVLTSSYKKLSDVRASGPQGESLAVERTDKHTWSVSNPSKGRVVFSYRVLADEMGLGFDYTHIDSRTAFINGPAAFVYLKGRLNEPHSLSIKVPNGWDVATPLTFKDSKYWASDYDEFIDSPIQMGAMARKRFAIGSIPFEVIYVGQSNEIRQDLDYETERIKRLSEPAIRMFGTVPFKKYMYIVHIGGGTWGGGLEHRASTVLDVGNQKPLSIDTLVTHEFFHTWNVKSFRPKVLGPFDYTQPCRTRNLWFAEGVTDYYSKLTAFWSGLYDVRWLFQSLAYEVAQLYRSPSRFRVTLEDACYNAWEHGGFGYKDLSYYNKGLLVGWLLDAAIVGATKGDKSLDDVMRSMYEKYRHPKPGYEEDAILKEVNAAAGSDLTAIYNAMVRSTGELPYGILRETLGLVVLMPDEPYWAVGFTDDGETVQSVYQDDFEAGLRVGDSIVHIERPNEQGYYSLEVERDGEAKTLRLRAFRKVARGYRVEPDPFASTQARKNLKKWLQRRGSFAQSKQTDYDPAEDKDAARQEGGPPVVALAARVGA